MPVSDEPNATPERPLQHLDQLKLSTAVVSSSSAPDQGAFQSQALRQEERDGKEHLWLKGFKWIELLALVGNRGSDQEKDERLQSAVLKAMTNSTIIDKQPASQVGPIVRMQVSRPATHPTLYAPTETWSPPERSSPQVITAVAAVAIADNANMPRTADQMFVHLPVYGLIVCKACKYAVWPDEVDSHLSGVHHRIAKQQRKSIVQEISLWQDLVVSAEELRLPAQLKDPIPELALHEGFLCKIKAENCQAVFTSQTTLKKHWVDDHDGWTITNRSTAGRPSICAKLNTQKRSEEAQCKVRCQRFFGSRHGSHYIHVVEQGSPECVILT
jgi:hypothetical protein